jgi:tryptophan halogenase
VSEARELPGRIVVAGDGPLGVLAAIAVRQALPSTEVIVIAIPPDPAAFAERIGTALPFTNRLHDRLGIDEEVLVTQAGASHRLVMRYFGGGGPGQHGAAGYGAAIDPAMKTAFAREWGGGPRNAETGAPPRSRGEVLAAAGRFAPPSGEADSPLAELDYAQRWNVPAYRDVQIQAAHRLGVRHERAVITGVVPDGGGGVAALAMDGGANLTADLYLDCSGSGAVLLDQLPEHRWIDWRGAFHARGLAIAAPAGAMLALEDRASWTSLGWRWELAGRDGHQAYLAVPGGASDEAIADSLGSDPVAIVPFAPGRLEAAWIGNVIGLGSSVVELEPLGGIAQDLAHRQLALLLELLPGRAMDEAERAEFNRRSALMADRAADWVAAHYSAPAPTAQFPSLSMSPELARTFDQFIRRGRVPFAEEAPMLVQELGALLQAIGVPQGEGPMTAAGEGRGEAAVPAFEESARAALNAAPPYGEWMQRVVAS